MKSSLVFLRASLCDLRGKITKNETNMLLNYIQENDNNFGNMEFHTAFKKQTIIV